MEANVPVGLLIVHQARFVHRDMILGNIVVVGGKAGISGLEFTEARKISGMQKLANRPEDSSAPAVVDICTLLRSFWPPLRKFSVLTGYG